MLFSEPLFLFVFLPPVFLLTWRLRRSRRARLGVLLLGSLGVYLWGEPRFVPVVVAAAGLDYVLAPFVARRVRGALVLGVGVNLAVLLFYKYLGFLADNLFALLPPGVASAVRAKGQFYWSVLQQSPAPFIAVGRDDVLYEAVYIDEYCTRDIEAFTPVAEAWAAKLMAMQRWYAARGKVFLYVLTPSKASIEPEDLPPGWPCPAAAADREGLHARYRAILQRAGVNLVDAVATTEAAKREYPFPPFPPGGTHFNDVAAARAVQELVAVLNRASSWRRMDDVRFGWRMGAPGEVDTDLRDAMNVPDSGMRYQTPAVVLEQPPGGHCVPVLMGQVGGSFAYQIDGIMRRLACPPEIDLYEYFRNTMAFYPADQRFPVDAKRRAWMLLDAADVVVLEENEELAARSEHGRAFYELVSERLAHPAP